VTANELTALLLEFTRDKLALRERHIQGAKRVGNYDFNNTYQYIINREDAQVSWLSEALAELGAQLPEGVAAVPLPPDEKRAAAEHAVIADDASQLRQFLDKWRARVKTMTNARHRLMLEVVLGETVEHERFFEQMLAGRDDVLGRRTGGQSTGGGVLPVRWLKQ
jgi:hypothetical protein